MPQDVPGGLRAAAAGPEGAGRAQAPAAAGPGGEEGHSRRPGQWQRYFWIAVGGQVLFIPLIFLMAGLWDPRKARQQALDHEAKVTAELATLNTSS
jgi:MFS transporter, ACS family, D-galactonate transporter